ncbi:TRAP transporter small permease subunit [Pseudovibrio exalbescens]|uniref:TRAP transporter small permease protein n=1 Tax=Pseudovibrio exalbescens TaxID=197461 RepID=A0A1U7JJ65_9HYPH|nr:TRAP transporter small permease [Pseudovibrio exalbescens]OKL44759.1 C4-dicarboxylate ABC transporter permease [Pseudovibrio exalbescens]
MSETEKLKELQHQVADGAIPEAGLLGRLVVKLGMVFAIGIVLSALILFYEVIMRYVFNSPTVWAHETVVFLSAIAFIFGGLYAAALNRHIRVVLIYDTLGPRLRRAFDVIISAVCMISSGFFAWASWQSVKRAVWTPTGDIHIETSGSAWNPPYPGMMKVFLLVILVVLAVQFFVLAINYARRKVED